jgi:sporulation protein YlmC with PRC-barrel domain
MTTDGTQDWQGRELVDSDGKKVGTVEEVYYDADTTRPEWAAVRSGLLGTRLSFVPITQVAPHGDQLRVPLENHRIMDAPSIDPEGELPQVSEEARKSASRPPATPTGESNREA